MQKHAMALGYFFLAVFCLFTSSQILQLQGPLLLAALFAAFTGVGFFLNACAEQIQAAKKWLLQIFWRLVRESEHPSNYRDKHST